MARYRLGVDIGGTFTDFALLDEDTGRIATLKVPSRAASPEDAIFEGLSILLQTHGFAASEIQYFIHGTTLAVNTVIQRNGARTALLVTQGFRDILNIGRHRIPDVFNFFTELPTPLVRRALVFEVPERCTATGESILPLDRAAVAAIADEIAAAEVDCVAVCLLHSYRNPAHEQEVRRILNERLGSAYISLSSEIWPQLREYERALIAVINAYVGRRMKAYFANLEAGLRSAGITAPILSTKSNGGVMHAREAGERPVETLLSGPAAGAIGAALLAKAAGIERVLAFDMGGTSADVAVIDGEPHYSTENQVGDFPVIMPAIDVSSIGAGGGSIAWTDANGVLKVGPVSAGASPGPACYGKGGEAATVTDAYVCLGIIDTERRLGGSVALTPGLAEASLAPIAAALGMDLRAAAEGVLRVATSQMYAALVPLMARKGINYEEFALLCFGGAGPTHGFLLAREIGIRRVIVPTHPGVLCALGALAADIRRDFVQTLHRRLEAGGCEPVMTAVADALEALSADGRAWLEAQALDVEEHTLLWTADMRYLGQSFELTVPLSAAAVADASGAMLTAAFHAEYERVYGYSDNAATVEILDLRVTAIGRTRKPPLTGTPAAAAAPVSARQRSIYFDGRTWTAQVYDRSQLGPGTRFAGPAIVEQYDTTTFIPPGFDAYVDECGNIVGDAQ